MGFSRVMMLVILTTVVVVVASASVAAAVKYDVCYKRCTEHVCKSHHHHHMRRPTLPPCEDLCVKKCAQEVHETLKHGGAGHKHEHGHGHRRGCKHGHGHGHGDGHGRGRGCEDGDGDGHGGGYLSELHDSTDKFCESRCLTTICKAEFITKLDDTSDEIQKVVKGCMRNCTKTCRRSSHDVAPAPGPVAMAPYSPPPVDHRRHCPGLVREAWPELVGQRAHLAQQIIQAEDPSVNAIIVKKGNKVPQDFRCDRVWVWSDTGMFGFVMLTPVIG